MANLLPTVYQRKLLITDALLKPTWEGSENMLEVKNLNVFYGPIHALKGISLKVKKGELWHLSVQTVLASLPLLVQ